MRELEEVSMFVGVSHTVCCLRAWEFLLRVELLFGVEVAWRRLHFSRSES
jgi:hypothetical protein